MRRRDFLASSLAASASAGLAHGETAGGRKSMTAREFYELRYYQLQRGSKLNLTHDYLREAAIPALNRIGIKPVGVFNVTVGPDSPSLFVLIPHPSADSVLTGWERVRRDKEYLERGANFLNAPASNPVYTRVEISLMAAFPFYPRVTPPPSGPRVFELRTYESATKKANLTKIKMFGSGEVDIFRRSGFHPVFFGEKLAGPRWPNLTYMLAADSIEARNEHWKAFISDPQWKKLSSMPEYSDEEIVCNITNCLLTPAPYSQI
jgi:NIPSNAP